LTFLGQIKNIRKETLKMKRIYYLFAAAAILLASACSTTNQTSTTDDVYYSKGDKVATATPKPAQTNPAPSQYDSNNDYARDNSQSSSTEQTLDANGNTYVTNNYYNADDYYDYAYSARLRRFYSPVSYNYYDPFYTNMYWYDYRPASWGMSIYLGYNFWAPAHCYYDPFWYGPGISFGYGYGGYYDPFWYPHYGGYWSGYNYGYMNGYNAGYYNGYYNGAYGNPYYYNSYDATSYNSGSYYGPRGSVSSNSRNGSSTSSNPRTLGERYQQAVAERTLPSMNTGKPVLNSRDNSSIAPAGGTKPVQNTRTETTKPSSVDGRTKPAVTSPRSVPVSIQNQTGGTKPVRNDDVPALGKPVNDRNDARTNPKENVIIRDNDLRNDVKSEPRNIPRDIQRNNPSRNETPKVDVPRSQPRTIEKPRGEQSQPRFEQRQEPRQFKQETPAPRQHSEPSRSNNSGGRRR
jgi:hypothetical protein